MKRFTSLDIERHMSKGLTYIAAAHQDWKALLAWADDERNADAGDTVRGAVFDRTFQTEDAIMRARPASLEDIVLQMEVLALRAKEEIGENMHTSEHVGRLLATLKAAAAHHAIPHLMAAE